MSGNNEFWQLPPIKERKGWASLVKKSGSIPEPGPKEVLVKIHAVSLNFRDLTISRNEYPLVVKQDEPVIPASDGAGEVVKVGAGTTLWKQGDRVVSIFNRDHLYGPSPDEQSAATGFGGAIDGFLQQYAVVPETAVVPIPEYLNYKEAATLTCAAVTAWNGLYGIASQSLISGQTVLIQGTGGVSVFGLQIALAAGANVIATSSSQQKFDKVLHTLSPEQQKRVQFINYTEVKEWGKEAVKLNGDKPLDFVIEIGGAGTAEQSFEAIKIGGIIANIGHRAAADGVPHIPYLALTKGVLFRGTLIGSRQQFLDLLRTFETHQIRPIIDREFSFEDTPKAYEYMWSGSHVGKVVINL
ncbi:hypothetical protein OC846_004892 [Tilletia horrida]|uniref:Enoyl reductase (ER) domain-containing protein n=1 Tax=Tilletia horrida TaxID=155126 RepID=A0AAN6GPL7_9BASI|nr:hypothetical protein OC845_005038 [Tilletia horrida]KAK0547351.1 hypothetical protein OC846_004892 [Tilletia horrida]KAK0562780.1 hypothetical protein OC861_005137 [Tilletia horrida]